MSQVLIDKVEILEDVFTFIIETGRTIFGDNDGVDYDLLDKRVMCVLNKLKNVGNPTAAAGSCTQELNTNPVDPPTGSIDGPEKTGGRGSGSPKEKPSSGATAAGLLRGGSNLSFLAVPAGLFLFLSL